MRGREIYSGVNVRADGCLRAANRPLWGLTMDVRSVRWPNLGEVHPDPGTWRQYDLLRTDAADYSVQTDLQGQVVWVSDELAQLSGRTPDELRGKPASTLIDRHDASRLTDSSELVRSGAVFDETPVHLVEVEGPGIAVAMRSRPIHANDGTLTGFLQTFIDVAEHSSILRALVTQSRCAGVMLRAESEAQVVQEVCESIVDNGAYTLAWFGTVEPDGSVAVAAQAGAHVDYVKQAKIRWDDTPTGRGPTGTAIRTGEAQVRNDLYESPTFAPWREVAQKFSLRSGVALPVFVDGIVEAALMIYADQTGAFDALARGLFEDLASDLGYVLTRFKAE